MIRILHVVDTLEVGGLENGLVNLIQRMDPRRFEHVVCTIRNRGSMVGRLPLERVRVTCLEQVQPGLSLQFAALSRQIRDLKPDIVHSRNWGAIEAVVSGWVNRCAVIHSEHGTELVNPSFEPRRRKWFRRLAFELADRVLCVSSRLRDQHALRTGFPAARISVIHNGVDTRRFCPVPYVRTHARQAFGISEDQFCIGAVGRLEPVKGLPILLRAAGDLPAGWDNWRILLAGTGTELHTLQSFLRDEPSLQGRVTFVGEISDIPGFLNALDAYVLPSLSEGISNSLLEAMATALPVIASDTGGNPEVLVHGQSGLLFPVGDTNTLRSQLMQLREQPELAARLSSGALHTAREHFSLESMVGEYQDLYAGLVPPSRQHQAPGGIGVS